MSLTYYRPNVSGLTVYVERLARGLAGRGHEVTVITSRHDSSLPEESIEDGVKVVRVPVALSINKGVVMPSLGRKSRPLLAGSDILNLHLPMLDAAGMAVNARFARKPVILSYHCDLLLPPSTVNRVIDRGVFAANCAAAKLADGIVAYTDDYAKHSEVLQRFPGKIQVIPPPIEVGVPAEDAIAEFQAKHDLTGRYVLGFASRFAAEKGIETLIRAMPVLLQKSPELKVLFAGPYREVIGEERYRLAMEPLLAELGDRWEFVGTLDSQELPAFYASLDALLMTSLNSTESFGLVQVESMLCGTPVIATDLPGVRQPILMTGMGVIVPPGDQAALVAAIEAVLSKPAQFARPRYEIEAIFDLRHTLDAYETLFESKVKQ